MTLYFLNYFTDVLGSIHHDYSFYYFSSYFIWNAKRLSRRAGLSAIAEFLVSKFDSKFLQRVAAYLACKSFILMQIILSIERLRENPTSMLRSRTVAETPQAPDDANVLIQFFRDNFIIFRRRSKRIAFSQSVNFSTCAYMQILNFRDAT